MILDDIVAAQQRGVCWGIPSICSAHPTVLKACLLYAREKQDWILIESTCNQVNQFGGYTGLRPSAFVKFVGEMADRNKIPKARLLLGGDHLGPNVWQDENAEAAMDKARRLVKDYVKAGYLKIHLDASMKLGDDPFDVLPQEVAAARTAELALAAEEAWKGRDRSQPPRYVIGTEVPVPGGAHQGEDHLRVTAAADVVQTLEAAQRAFKVCGLESAWERVVALVVQPGVEFGGDFILEYDRSAAKDLSRFIENQNLVYEAHSTDYQTRQALREMVEDHFAILKVGPALTFAYREAIYALAMMENELFLPENRSNLVEVLDQVMVATPVYWQKYYSDEPIKRRFDRRFSFSDRSRYYWTSPKVREAVNMLKKNLGAKPLPLSLVSQFSPRQYRRIRRGRLANQPEQIVLDRIKDVLVDYWMAAQSQEGKKD
jgi:D-tagatose-1,6-bisphosphate aldolase subunit GatZ/KbaZ